MLVLSRKVMESIAIGENVVVTLLGMRGNSVRIGIEAPEDISIRRTELDELTSKPSNGTVAASVIPRLLRDSGGDG